MLTNRVRELGDVLKSVMIEASLPSALTLPGEAEQVLIIYS